MKYFVHIPIFLLLVVYSSITHAQDDYDYDNEQFICAETIDHNFLRDDLLSFRREYYHYALYYYDSKTFPKQREQEEINHYIERFKMRDDDCALSKGNEKLNIMAYMANLPMAKLFLNHGADIIEYYDLIPPLVGVTVQGYRRNEDPSEVYSHDELRYNVERKSWYGDNDLPMLPSNYAISLSKLYLALGADINATGKFKDVFSRDGNGDFIKYSIYNALQISLTTIVKNITVEYVDNGYIIRPDKQHRADDIKPPIQSDLDSDWHYYYYRSPVTYWLESFIAAGYPASMLDTHQMLYPRFMKRASVKDVASILANPEKYKIPVNLNCPYRGAAPESGVTPDSDITASNLDATCPLTPSINMRDAMGRTPLHIAGLAKNKAVYDFLITQGADITIKDFRDNLPILK